MACETCGKASELVLQPRKGALYMKWRTGVILSRGV